MALLQRLSNERNGSIGAPKTENHQDGHTNQKSLVPDLISTNYKQAIIVM